MDWPAQSTDLNPIDTAINSAWESFPSDRLNNLIVSMSRRCSCHQLHHLLNIKTFGL